MIRQVCPLCALDDYLVAFASTTDVDRVDLLCENPSCGAYRWTPTVQSADSLPLRTGIAEEFGVYDDLLACIGAEDPWLEYGIVEYRYARLRPDLYLGEFLPRWGHTIQGPRKYSVSSFLGAALGALTRTGDIDNVYKPATGYWSYNSRISYVTQPRTPRTDAVLTWADFAAGEGLDPNDWTLPEM